MSKPNLGFAKATITALQKVRITVLFASIWAKAISPKDTLKPLTSFTRTYSTHGLIYSDHDFTPPIS